MPKMDEQTFKSVVSQLMSNALGFENTAISQARQKAIKYYYGDLMGTELPGRSKIVSQDVSDTIGMLLPAIIKKFNSTNNAVEFEADNPQGEEEAEQKTLVANHVFYKDNDGFLVLYDSIFDCLLEKNAYIKCYNEENTEVNTETYEGLSEDEYTLLIGGEEFDTVEVLSHSDYPDPNYKPAPVQQIPGQIPAPVPPVPMLHDIKVRNTKKTRKTCIEVIPPEEFIITSNSVSLERAQCKGHRRRMSHSDLMEMGIDVSKMDLPVATDYGLYNLEAQQRFKDENNYIYNRGVTSDPATHEVWVTELYTKLDYDGDGIAEMRYILLVGDDTNNIVKNEEADDHPYIDFSPIRIPHKHRGRSIADVVMDIQDVKTTTLRQALDNMYLANNMRTLVDRSANVDIDALLSGRMNAVIFTDNLAGVTPLVTPDLGQVPYTMLQYMDDVKENRTGETKYSQGSDSNSLNNTATGINIITTNSQKREDLIASLVADGLKKLFYRIIELEAKHSTTPRVIKAAGQWQTIDPREWKFKTNVTANVGLGTGNKDQMMGHLQVIAQLQAAMLQSPNLASIVNPENAFNTAAEMVKNSGLPNPEKFFTDPSKQGQQPPSPQAQAAEQAQQQAAADQKQQVQAQQDAVKADLNTKLLSINNKHEIDKAHVMMETEKAHADAQIKLRELSIREHELALKYHQAGAAIAKPIFTPLAGEDNDQAS